MTDCVYCGSPVDRHDPVFVSEGSADAPPDAFCNYACLQAHVEEASLTAGATCEWSPPE